MKKQIIKLTEEDLHRIIAETVNEIVDEDFMARARACGFLSPEELRQLEVTVDDNHRNADYQNYLNRPKSTKEFVKTYDID